MCNAHDLTLEISLEAKAKVFQIKIDGLRF